MNFAAMWLLIEPVNGGNQEVVYEDNFLNWTLVRDANGKVIPDRRKSYGDNVWQVVKRAEDPKELQPGKVPPVAAKELPTPILPPEAKEVGIAPKPEIELDPAGNAQETKRGPGRPAKAKA